MPGTNENGAPEGAPLRAIRALVPRRGLEPPQCCHRQDLNLVRLPIPPSRHERAQNVTATAGDVKPLKSSYPDAKRASSNAKEIRCRERHSQRKHQARALRAADPYHRARARAATRTRCPAASSSCRSWTRRASPVARGTRDAAGHRRRGGRALRAPPAGHGARRPDHAQPARRDLRRRRSSTWCGAWCRGIPTASVSSSATTASPTCS